MPVLNKLHTLDSILSSYNEALGQAFEMYHNHCYRIVNYFQLMSPLDSDAANILEITAAFHDLGIWTHNTFDYINPSVDLVQKYLSALGMDKEFAMVRAMIVNHHKIKSYTGEHELMVENFRKADWIDVSAGYLLFNINQNKHKDIVETFPYNGFHKRITQLTLNHFKKHPLKPLPMFKW